MDYQIVISPEFNINPDAFLSAWNDDVDCRDTALAERLDQAVEMCALPSALSPFQIAKMAKQVRWREFVETGAGHGSTHSGSATRRSRS